MEEYMTDLNHYYEIKGIKYALLAMFAILSLAFFAIAPVSATDLIVSGQVAPSLQFECFPTTIVMPMTVGSNTKADAEMPLITVTANSNWYVKAQDMSNAMAGVASDGRLNYLSSGGGFVQKMQSPLDIGVGGNFQPLTGSMDTIKTGTPGIFSERLQFRQIVVPGDLATTGGASYWMKLGVIGGATL